MTVPMLMMPPPAVRRRFSDWPLALKSILGFWCFYALTVVLRALLAPNAMNAIATSSIVDRSWHRHHGLHLFGDRGRSAAPKTSAARTIIAAIASVIAAMVMAGTLISFEGKIQVKEEFRYQAREGFVVIEKNNRITIERNAQEPLVLTMPRMSEMGFRKQFRWIADSAIVWLFMFMAWSAYYIATNRRPKLWERSGRLADAESAAQAAQVSALRYQVNPHFLFNTLNSLSSLVMTGRTDRAETMLLALSTFFRTSLSLDPRPTSRLRRKSIFSDFISISRNHVSPIACTWNRRSAGARTSTPARLDAATHRRERYQIWRL